MTSKKQTPDTAILDDTEYEKLGSYQLDEYLKKYEEDITKYNGLYDKCNKNIFINKNDKKQMLKEYMTKIQLYHDVINNINSIKMKKEKEREKRELEQYLEMEKKRAENYRYMSNDVITIPQNFVDKIEEKLASSGEPKADEITLICLIQENKRIKMTDN
jgi:hypothetical protein